MRPGLLVGIPFRGPGCTIPVAKGV